MPDSDSTHSRHHQELLARLDAIRDVHDALVLVEALVNPHMKPGTWIFEPERERLGSMLKVLNDALSERLSAFYSLLALMKARGM